MCVCERAKEREREREKESGWMCGSITFNLKGVGSFDRDDS